jgi:hypothetical protein
MRCVRRVHPPVQAGRQATRVAVGIRHNRRASMCDGEEGMAFGVVWSCKTELSQRAFG